MPQPVWEDKEKHYTLSVYNNVPASQDSVLQAVAKLDAAFPNSFKNNEDKNRFYAVLTEMIADERMTEQRLRDAIKNVIKTRRTYSQINIADIVGFDKRLRLYSVDDVYNLTGRFPHDDYALLIRNGKRYWVSKAQCESYGINPEQLNVSNN